MIVQHKVMLYFVIPLMSKKVAKDWEMVSTLFNRTLWSCYNQTDFSAQR